jgi:hypothetical protein
MGKVYPKGYLPQLGAKSPISLHSRRADPMMGMDAKIMFAVAEDSKTRNIVQIDKSCALWIETRTNFDKSTLTIHWWSRSIP